MTPETKAEIAVLRRQMHYAKRRAIAARIEAQTRLRRAAEDDRIMLEMQAAIRELGGVVR